jgi:hypothetical protein
MGPHFNGKRLGMMVHTCHSTYLRKYEIGESKFSPFHAESKTLSPK